MKNQIDQIQADLKSFITLSPQRAAAFFKTGKGDYAEFDRFRGIKVPDLRKIARKYEDIPLNDLQLLIQSTINEERLLALIILTRRYAKTTQKDKEILYQFYILNLRYVNNWNLVDASAHLIMGEYLWKKPKRVLMELAHSDILWERRIAIVSTWCFIKKGDLLWTFKVATLLLKDPHDLIHKAVGWMLREAGKKDKHQLVDFLNQHKTAMPRTMLRYAIERFPERERKTYLKTKQLKNKNSPLLP
ncbi:MAG: hypothetical protein K0R12_348 [Gammaproteobacteria bacterium]|jgi:3-methyladenine DNA glycosylase AlkD|nr:hypothetical protein [Gammaproteobacteria bacterium]